VSYPIQRRRRVRQARFLKRRRLKLSRGSGSRGGHTSFSVDLATEGNQRVFELDLKLSTMKKQLALVYEYGHFDIRCQNLTIGYQKTKCHSSYKALDDPIRKLLN